MKMKKVLTWVLATVMCVTALSACGEKKGDKVVLKYIMPGPGMQEDSEKVWAEWNKKLQEKLPNVEVDFEIIPTSEYAQSFALMMSAGEQVDIANTYMLDFATEVKRGTFAPLDELIEEHASGIKENLPEWFLNYQKVDGVTYGIPSYQMCGSIPALFFFKEQAEKYLDIDGLTAELNKNNRSKEKIYEYLEEMLKNAKADGVTYKTTQILWSRCEENIGSRFIIPTEPDKEVNVQYSLLDDEYKREYEIRSEWFEKGYIRKDALGATDDSKYVGQLDGLPWWTTTYSPGYEETLSEKYGHELIAIPFYDGYYIPSKNSAAGTSIISTSKHKDEAMQVMNLLQSDKELYNMLVYGLEGEHYTKIGDDRIETPTGAQATSSDKYGLWSWIVGNTSIAYDLQTTKEGYKTWVFDEVNQSAWRSKLLGFVLDTSNISTELAQIEALAPEYWEPLKTGAVENWEEVYNEWKEKFEIAGGLEVQAEIQRQVDEFLASK